MLDKIGIRVQLDSMPVGQLETVFQWPGLGLLFINAVEFADVPFLATYLVLVSAFFVLINLIVDLLYYRVDPRLRGGLGAPK